MKPKLDSIRFSRGVGVYNAGEVAGFMPEVAKRYVDNEVAEYVTPPPATGSAAIADAPDSAKKLGKGM